jgi:hypothetical protein
MFYPSIGDRETETFNSGEPVIILNPVSCEERIQDAYDNSYYQPYYQEESTGISL